MKRVIVSINFNNHMTGIAIGRLDSERKKKRTKVQTVIVHNPIDLRVQKPEGLWLYLVLSLCVAHRRPILQ